MKDPQIQKFIKGLTETREDPMHVVWSHVNDAYEDGDCCTALRMMSAALGASQRGRVAREDRKFDSCPYPAFEGAPISNSDFLRVAWMAGYSACDHEKRMAQAEAKLYDAYNKLTPIREYTDRTFDVLNLEAQTDFGKSIRNVHGTMLTSAVKQRIADERRAATDALNLENDATRERIHGGY